METKVSVHSGRSEDWLKYLGLVHSWLAADDGAQALSVQTAPSHSNSSSMAAIIGFLNANKSLALYFCLLFRKSRTLKYNYYWKPSKDRHITISFTDMHMYVLWTKIVILHAKPCLQLAAGFFSSLLHLTITCFWSNLTISLALKDVLFTLKQWCLLIRNLKSLLENFAHGSQTLPGSRQFIWHAVVLNVIARMRTLYKARLGKIQWKSYSKASASNLLTPQLLY